MISLIVINSYSSSTGVTTPSTGLGGAGKQFLIFFAFFFTKPLLVPPHPQEQSSPEFGVDDPVLEGVPGRFEDEKMFFRK